MRPISSHSIQSVNLILLNILARISSYNDIIYVGKTKHREDIRYGIGLFYFSGTGNSLYVTKEISRKPNAEYAPIARIIRRGRIEIDIATIGIPEIVKRLIAQISRPSAAYIFAVVRSMRELRKGNSIRGEAGRIGGLRKS